MKKLKLSAIFILFVAVSGFLRPISGAALPEEDDASGDKKVDLEVEVEDEAVLATTPAPIEAEADGLEDQEVTFKGHKLIEAVPMTSDNLEFLRTLDETVPEDVLDFWSTPVKPEEPVPILVHPELMPHVVEAFEVSRAKYIFMRYLHCTKLLEDSCYFS